MSVGFILNLLNKFNKSILFYLTCSINLVMNLHEFNIIFITYPKRNSRIVKKHHFSPTHLLYNAKV